MTSHQASAVLCVGRIYTLEFKNSIIYEQNTKEIIAVKESICDKTYVDFHKTFASIFSAYTTSILKILS